MDSLGRTTCLTGTDTAATANFNKVAAAAAVADVNGTPASVTTALAAISNGTLAGLVPGAAVIANVAAAAAAIDTFAKATAVANPTFDGIADNDTVNGTNVKDGSVNSFEALDALSGATTARSAAIVATNAGVGSATGKESTAQLTATQSDAVTATATAKTAALDATGGTGFYTGAASVKAIADFDAAVAAKAALVLTPEQTQAAAVAQAGALAGVQSAIAATGATVTEDTLTAAFGSPVTSATLYANLTDISSAPNHAALVTELLKVPTFGAALIASADKDIAVAKAGAAVTAATAEVAKIDSAGTPATTDGEGVAYATAALGLAAKTAALAAATKADAAVVTAKAVVDQYTILNKASSDALTAVGAFNTANTAKFNLAVVASVDASAKQDVFFFPTKITTTDFTIGGTTTTFGAGDSIVIGSGYTFNAGALTTGNNTALEVFFVKGATGTQVVIETNVVGSATATTDTAGTVLLSNEAAVINLVGVTADHLSFNNGVVSYV